MKRKELTIKNDTRKTDIINIVLDGLLIKYYGKKKYNLIILWGFVIKYNNFLET